jgi:hypothetical protein
MWYTVENKEAGAHPAFFISASSFSLFMKFKNLHHFSREVYLGRIFCITSPCRSKKPADPPLFRIR